MQVTVLNNQTLQDIAIRYCGTIAAVIDIALLNNISITQELDPGQILIIPIKDYGFQEIVNYFILESKEPATSLAEENIISIESGIGYMQIENNFKVS